jgi:hypothetical protein
MFWPYVFLILAIVSASVALAGVAPMGLFGIASAAFFLAFIGMTLRTFQKFGM